jgi:hypothetical protein
MGVPERLIRRVDRRRFLQHAGVLGGIAATFPAWADSFVDLDLPGGPDRRELEEIVNREISASAADTIKKKFTSLNSI